MKYDIWYSEHADMWTVDLYDEIGYLRTQHFGTERDARKFIEENEAKERVKDE